jgi:hypothetical protein
MRNHRWPSQSRSGLSFAAPSVLTHVAESNRDWHNSIRVPSSDCIGCEKGTPVLGRGLLQPPDPLQVAALAALGGVLVGC